MSHLTCREHLTFHSINRMSYKHATEQCLARVDEVSESGRQRMARKLGSWCAGLVERGLAGGKRGGESDEALSVGCLSSSGLRCHSFLVLPW